MTSPGFGPEFGLIPGLLLADNAGRTSPLYADRSPVLAMLDAVSRSSKVAGTRSSSGQRFWSTPPRSRQDPNTEVMEVSLASPREINFLRFDVAHFPHTTEVQYQDPVTADWHSVKEPSGTPVVVTVFDSVPALINTSTIRTTNTHPQHYGAEHWITHDLKVQPFVAQNLRLMLKRNPDSEPPQNLLRQEIAYSLGIRGLNFGYRVESLADIDLTRIEPDTLTTSAPFAQTIDLLGSGVNFRLRQNKGEHLLADGIWKCETQPVNYSVVNLYLDVRDEVGGGQIIDRLYLDPLTSGPNVNIYFATEHSEDPEQSVWTPITSDFKLRRGFYNFLPARMTTIKLEFTNLTPEPYDSHTTVARKIKLFTTEIVASAQPDQTVTGDAGTRVMVDQNIAMYRDNSRALPNLTNTTRGFTPTEVLYSDNPNTAGRLRNASDAYNYLPWQSSLMVPRFSETGLHVYQEVEMSHTQRVGFTVGLKAVQAFRVAYTADDDTEQYLDLYQDRANFTGTAQITEQGLVPAPADPDDGFFPSVAESRVFTSRREVYGIQFATTQTSARQLLPDDDFNAPDPTHAWQSVQSDVEFPTTFERSNAYSTDIGSTVMVQRSGAVIPPPPGQTEPGTYRAIEKEYPVESYELIRQEGASYDDLRGFTTSSAERLLNFGGIESTSWAEPTQVGRVYAAVRVICPRTLTGDQDLYLQIIDRMSGSPVAEQRFSVKANQVTEAILAYTPDDNDNRQIGVRLVQYGQATYAWYVDTLSLYDEAILWEFSNDGGETYHPAYDIRNDANGMLIFPQEPEVLRPNTYNFMEGKSEWADTSGNTDVGGPEFPTWAQHEKKVNSQEQATWDYVEWPGRIDPPPALTKNRLRYRVTLFRPEVAVSALSIRPMYVDTRSGVLHQIEADQVGPSLSGEDWYQGIQNDPRFRAWNKAVPEDWFFFYRQFLLLRHDNYIPVLPGGYGTYLDNTFVVPVEEGDTP